MLRNLSLNDDLLAATGLTLSDPLDGFAVAQAPDYSNLTVTSGADSGAGTLRDALGMAGLHSTIYFDPSINQFTLSAPLICSQQVTIIGGPRSGAVNAVLTGSGSLILNSDVSLSNLTIGGSVLLRNNGNLTQTGDIALGDTSGGTAQITNASGRTWTMGDSKSILRGSSNAMFNNAGTLVQTGSFDTIGARIVNNSGTAGRIVVSSYLYAVNPVGSDLQNQTIVNADGKYGLFYVSGGVNTLGVGTTLSVYSFQTGPNTTLKLTSNLSYNGFFAENGATTLDLGTSALSLSGMTGLATTTLLGSGKLLLTGTSTSLSGGTFGGSTLVRLTGTLNQYGALTLGDGSGGAAQITVAAGATWSLAYDVGIAAGNTAAVINLGGGTLIKNGTSSTATRSVIAPNIVNQSSATGTIEAAQGKLELGGTLSGALALKADAGTTLLLDKAASAGTAFSFNGSGSTLQLNDAPGFAGSIAGLGTSENLDLRSIGYGSGTTLSYAGNGSNGTLTVGDGAHTANLALLGSYTQASFHLASDGHGGSAISYG